VRVMDPNDTVLPVATAAVLQDHNRRMIIPSISALLLALVVVVYRTAGSEIEGSVHWPIDRNVAMASGIHADAEVY
jgi:hypothetical protein